VKSCLDCRIPIRKGVRCPTHQRQWEIERQERFPQQIAYTDPAYKRYREALLRGGPECWLCGQPGADSIDHVIPLSSGGSNEPGNLRPAHQACNSRKHDGRYRTPDEGEEGRR